MVAVGIQAKMEGFISEREDGKKESEFLGEDKHWNKSLKHFTTIPAF